MPWTVDEIKSLLSEIKNKPVLWNVFSDEWAYRDREEKRSLEGGGCEATTDQTEVSVSPTVQYYLFFDQCFCLC